MSSSLVFNEKRLAKLKTADFALFASYVSRVTSLLLCMMHSFLIFSYFGRIATEEFWLTIL